MTYYNTLITVIEEEISKCKATASALRIGSNFTMESYGEKDEYGRQKKRITYEDGTVLNLNYFGDIESLTTSEGKTLNYFYHTDEDYEVFKDQKDRLIGKYGQEKYDMLCKYADEWGSWEGLYMNKYFRGKISKADLVEKYSNAKDLFHSATLEDLDFLLDNHDDFINICGENSLNGYGDFISIRAVSRLHDNDPITKKIVWDKGHTSASVGLDGDDMRMYAGSDGWKIVTIYEDGNDANRGLFLGNLKNDYHKGMTMDWEHEIHTAPNQKTERLIIDTKNKYIIQRPYTS